jgi:hypothetical protein
MARTITSRSTSVRWRSLCGCDGDTVRFWKISQLRQQRRIRRGERNEYLTCGPTDHPRDVQGSAIRSACRPLVSYSRFASLLAQRLLLLLLLVLLSFIVYSSTAPLSVYFTAACYTSWPVSHRYSVPINICTHDNGSSAA